MNNTSKKREYMHIALVLLCSYVFLSPTFAQETKYVKLSNTDTIALISTYLEIVKPAWPPIGTVVVNTKVNSIAPELKIMMEDNINKIRRNVVLLLKNNLNCGIIYGQGLQINSGFCELKKEFNFDPDLKAGDDKYPGIVYAKDDLNPFEIAKTEVHLFKSEPGEDVKLGVVTFFEIEDNYKNTVVEICEKLKVNYLAISYSYFQIFPFESNKTYYTNGDGLSIVAYIYIFNNKGECISSGFNRSKPVVFQPRQIEDYQHVLNNHMVTLKPVIEKIAGK